VDLHAMAAEAGVDLAAAFIQLRALLADVDARNAKHTQTLDLPCHRGCSMCCHESVFLTPLEFFHVWDYVQTQFTETERSDIVAQGLALYAHHAPTIRALSAPPPAGDSDHFAIARTLKFACPMLSASGACRVYPVRELLARVFGCSFNDEGGVYGCHLVAAHLADKTVTLVQARPTWRRLLDLPLTGTRQVYPYYIHLLYG
jgi:Fe-S-cluster containining protein